MISLFLENADWRWALMSQLPIKSPFKVGRETIPHSLINFIRIFLMNEETAKAKFEDMKTAQKVRFITSYWILKNISRLI